MSFDGRASDDPDPSITGRAVPREVTVSRLLAMSAVFLALSVCARVAPGRAATPSPIPASYLDYSGRYDVLSGGVKMIPIETHKGTFHVWTKRVGNNPRIKVLLLHEGPGFSLDYLKSVDSYLTGAQIV